VFPERFPYLNHFDEGIISFFFAASSFSSLSCLGWLPRFLVANLLPFSYYCSFFGFLAFSLRFADA